MIHRRRSVVFFLGVAVYPPDTFAVQPGGALLEAAVGIAHDNSFGKSAEVADAIFFRNAIPGPASGAPGNRLSIPEALFHGKME